MTHSQLEAKYRFHLYNIGGTWDDAVRQAAKRSTMWLQSWMREVEV